MKKLHLFLLISTYLFKMTAYAEVHTGSKDPSKIIGNESCMDCHESAHKIWEGTKHHTTFLDLHENSKAEGIATKMGIDPMDISTNKTCQQCHFTVKKTKAELKPIAGISCESCHGAGADWVDIHNDTDIPYEERMMQAAKKGMNRPNDMYGLFKNCYECHNVPNEDIVNKGGHPTSSSFELVSWSQGEIRHTFNSDETVNEKASTEKKRILFVLGKALELETALQGFSVATDSKGAYFKAMAKRFKASLGALKKISKVTKDPKIAAIISALGTKLNPKDKASLNEAIKNLKVASQDFANNANPDNLKALDPILPKKTKGEPALN